MNTPRPYSQRKLRDGTILREFQADTRSEELVWHQDREHRSVRVIESGGWMLQLEEGLPFPLVEGNTYEIPSRSWHRVVRGPGNLKIEIQEGNQMRITELQLRELIREEILREAEESAEQGEPGLTKSIMKGATRGASRFGFKKAIETGLSFGAKSIPVLGSMKAYGDLISAIALLTKDTKDFTIDLLEISKVKLSRVSSILGEYSIFAADPSDVRKVIAGLRQNMTEEQRQDLLTHWEDILDGLKEVIVDFLLSFKEFTLELSLPVAFIIKILPVETLIKDYLFYVHRLLNKNPEILKIYKEFLYSYGSHGEVVLSMINFIANGESISAFAELDELINQEVDPGRARALRTAGKITQKGTEIFKYVDDIGQQIAKGIGDGIASGIARGF